MHFGAEALGDVFVERETGAARLVRVVALIARRIDHVEVDVVGVGLPGQGDAQGVAAVEVDVVFAGAGRDLGAALRVLVHPGAVHISELFVDHALHGAVPGREGLARGRLQHARRFLEAPFAPEHQRQVAIAVGAVGTDFQRLAQRRLGQAGATRAQQKQSGALQQLRLGRRHFDERRERARRFGLVAQFIRGHAEDFVDLRILGIERLPAQGQTAQRGPLVVRRQRFTELVIQLAVARVVFQLRLELRDRRAGRLLLLRPRNRLDLRGTRRRRWHWHRRWWRCDGHRPGLAPDPHRHFHRLSDHRSVGGHADRFLDCVGNKIIFRRRFDPCSECATGRKILHASHHASRHATHDTTHHTAFDATSHARFGFTRWRRGHRHRRRSRRCRILTPQRLRVRNALPRDRRRRDHHLRPVETSDAARVDRQNLRQRAAVESEALIVPLRLQHEHRGARDDHALLDADLHLLRSQRAAHGVRGLVRLAGGQILEVRAISLALQ